jgi:hypothetical protein
MKFSIEDYLLLAERQGSITKTPCKSMLQGVFF